MNDDDDYVLTPEDAVQWTELMKRLETTTVLVHHYHESLLVYHKIAADLIAKLKALKRKYVEKKDPSGNVKAGRPNLTLIEGGGPDTGDP